MPLQLYNSLTRRKEAFEPLNPERVTVYVCGPTVYNLAHIGNARPPVVFDVLRRVLSQRYSQVVFARNITDIDDKIMAAAAAEGVDIDTITARYTEAYLEDVAALNVAPPGVAPHATEHLAEMIELIGTLIDGGHAYVSEGHVLFAVESYAEYGRLSGRSLDEMVAGARVEVADYKRHPGDFVLWKPSSSDQPGWDSPWGRGRPGWHIECSAMAAKHLGTTIDIHGGGVDLQFPHHENEIAQSVCAHKGAEFARYWMHNGLLTMGEEKMSKSLGNIRTIRELREEYPGEVLRLALLSAHYRQPLAWTQELLEQSTRTLDRAYRALERLGPVDVAPMAPDALINALEDDLNTPRAISVMAHWIGEANTAQSDAEKRQAAAMLTGCGAMLGLLAQDPAQWLAGDAEQSELAADQIEALLSERQDARASRDFARADDIRDQLAAAGVVIEDTSEGAKWRYQR